MVSHVELTGRLSVAFVSSDEGVSENRKKNDDVSDIGGSLCVVIIFVSLVTTMTTSDVMKHRIQLPTMLLRIRV